MTRRPPGDGPATGPQAGHLSPWDCSAVKEILLTVAHNVHLGCEEDRDYRKSE